jgi:thiosulfate/3-mercaptopyruvate sulfurtransferase
MSSNYTNIVSARALAEIGADCVLLDCRTRIGSPDWGAAQYAVGHLPGALHADLDTDLASVPGSGGRHPLPPRARWLACVRRWGIENSHQVVVYDDAGGAFAARAWWMLRWLGHASVAVLDGGLAAWSGTLTSGSEPQVSPSAFEPADPLTRIIEAGALSGSLVDYAGRLIDARDEKRFDGSTEPIDPVAGHIPGAVCLPFQGNLRPDGRFKSASELRTRFACYDDAVCYCGSGVTACHNILAMHIAGLPEPQLFVDSWSGWIADPSRPRAP